MIFLIILGIILLVLGLILFLPVKISLAFKDELNLKVNFFGLKIFETKNETEDKKKKFSKAEKKEAKTQGNKAKKLFSRLKEKYGFSGALKEIFSFFLKCLSHIKGLLRHINIKRICLNITVASYDAAKTAIEYGAVCAAVYPVLALIDTVPNISFREINVKSDFNSEGSQFDFSFVVKMQIFFALLSAFKIYKEYKNFIIRIEDNE